MIEPVEPTLGAEQNIPREKAKRTMKTYKQKESGLFIQSAQFCALTLALVCAGGCRTASYERSDAVARSFQTASAEVQGETRALELTIAALNELVDKPSMDLKRQFERFSKSLDWLETTADRNNSAANQVARRDAAYLDNWNKEVTTMKYEVIRTRSEARKADVTAHFEAVNRRYAEARIAMQPLVDYLKDIRKALGTDLTPDGLEAAKPIISNAGENAAKVQAALSRLTNELAASSVRTAPMAFRNAGSQEGEALTR
jgi:hypothetical protein